MAVTLGSWDNIDDPNNTNNPNNPNNNKTKKTLTKQQSQGGNGTNNLGDPSGTGAGSNTINLGNSSVTSSSKPFSPESINRLQSVYARERDPTFKQNLAEQVKISENNRIQPSLGSNIDQAPLPPPYIQNGNADYDITVPSYSGPNPRDVEFSHLPRTLKNAVIADIYRAQAGIAQRDRSDAIQAQLGAAGLSQRDREHTNSINAQLYDSANKANIGEGDLLRKIIKDNLSGSLGERKLNESIRHHDLVNTLGSNKLAETSSNNDEKIQLAKDNLLENKDKNDSIQQQEAFKAMSKDGLNLQGKLGVYESITGKDTSLDAYKYAVGQEGEEGLSSPERFGALLDKYDPGPKRKEALTKQWVQRYVK